MPELPFITATRTNLAALRRGQHYVVAAYGSRETFNHRVLVVTDHVDTPTWLIPAGRRKVTRSALRGGALLVPRYADASLEMIQELTGVVTDFQCFWPYQVGHAPEALSKMLPELHAAPAPWKADLAHAPS